MSKQEREYLDIYFKNRKRKGTDWPNVVKELRTYLSACDDERLEFLKWEIARYKKSYDMNNYFSVYMVLIAVMSIFYNMFDVGDSVNHSGASPLIIMIISILFVSIFILFPFVRSTAKHMTTGHFFDIYSQIIEEMICYRAKKKEQDENREQSQERLEYIVKILDSRSPLKRMGVLFNRK